MKKVILLLALVPQIAMAQVSFNWAENFECARTIDKCWDNQVPLLCINDSAQNVELYGEVIGESCNRTLADRQIYENNLKLAAGEVLKQFRLKRLYKRKLYKLRQKCNG